LTKSILSKLARTGHIIVYSRNKKILAMGIWNKSSRLDDDVMQLGYINGSKDGVKSILKFLQNKGFEEKSDRIQLLVQHKINLAMKDLDRRMLFCLMKKEL
jgi:hypothetical protein